MPSPASADGRRVPRPWSSSYAEPAPRPPTQRHRHPQPEATEAHLTTGEICRYGEVPEVDVGVEVVVDDDVVDVEVDEVVVGGRVVVVGRIVVLVDDVVVDVLVTGAVSGGEESSPFLRASTTRAPAASTMASTRTVRPMAAHGDFFGGGTGPPGPP